MKLKTPHLFKNGFHQSSFPLPPVLKEAVEKEDWGKVDDILKDLTSPAGSLYQYLQNYHEFNSIEFIIAIRDAKNDWEEDGIWHDDGSRVFAFSLSLTIGPSSIQGGILGIRRKGETDHFEIKTPPFGGIIMFLTGHYHFEHKIHQVKDGRRIIIAGWCS